MLISGTRSHDPNDSTCKPAKRYKRKQSKAPNKKPGNENKTNATEGVLVQSTSNTVSTQLHPFAQKMNSEKK